MIYRVKGVGQRSSDVACARADLFLAGRLLRSLTRLQANECNDCLTKSSTDRPSARPPACARFGWRAGRRSAIYSTLKEKTD